MAGHASWGMFVSPYCGTPWPCSSSTISVVPGTAPTDHLDVALEVHVDGRSVLGVLGPQDRKGVGEEGAGVVLQVPLAGAHDRSRKCSRSASSSITLR